jgi:hypothetical protein
MFAGFFLLGVVLTLVTAITGGGGSEPPSSGGSAPGVPWGTVAALGVLGVLLVVHLTLMARNLVCYVFSGGLIATNFLGRPTASGRWADLSIRQRVRQVYVNGRYHHTVIGYEVADSAGRRLRFALRQESETNVLLEVLLGTMEIRGGTG